MKKETKLSKNKTHRTKKEKTASSAPVLTPLPPVNITKGLGHHSEAAIAINPINPRNIVAGCNSPAGNVEIMVSQDGGLTWAKRIVGTGTGAGGDGLPKSFCDPSIAFDRFGNCYLVYLTLTESCVLVRSRDSGATFGHPVTIAGPGTDQPTVAAGPGIKAGTASVWVTFHNSHGSISARGAVANGLDTVGAFGAEFIALGSNGGNFGDVAVGPKGQVMVTYELPVNNEGPSAIFVNMKPDGTGPFGGPVKVTNTNVGGFDKIPAQSERSIDAEAGLAWDCTGGAHKGRVYLIYTEEPIDESNDTDVLIRFSDNDGATWSKPVKVSDDTKKRSQFLCKLALDQTSGKLGAIFYDCRRDDGTVGPGGTNHVPNDDVHVFGTASSDGAASWARNIQITTGVSNGSDSNNPNEFADYIGLAFHKGTMLAAWTDNSNSTGDNPDGALHGGDIYTAGIQVL